MTGRKLILNPEVLMIDDVCKIYRTMTYNGHKPKEGYEKARCMLHAHKEYGEISYKQLELIEVEK